MLVNLKRGWQAPDGKFPEPAGNPHTFPLEWKDLLPSTAEILDEKAAPPPDDEDDEKPAPKPVVKK